MSTAIYHIGDTRDIVATLETGSIDLVLTSPPFLALRSYLPDGHPDKDREIGSEPTPAEFVDTLLDLTAEWRRVLAPHGSIAVELGDTYSSSGGTTDNRENSLGGNDQAPRPDRGGGDGWPLAKSLTLIPELFRIALVYGINPLTGNESPAGQWRVRNVVRWVRPNPPVGALGDKYRPATSVMVIACISDKRWFDLDAVRTPFSPNSATPHASEGDHVGRFSTKKGDGRVEVNKGRGNASAENRRSVNTHKGAPPLDWWNIPTHGYPGAHYATWPPKLCEIPIRSMVPLFVCEDCGIALGSTHDLPRTMPRVRGDVPGPNVDEVAERKEAQSVLFETLREPLLSEEPGHDQREDPDDEGLHSGTSAGPPDGRSVGLRDGTPPTDGSTPGTHAGTRRGRSPRQRGEGRQPHREPRSDEETGPRSSEQDARVAHDGVSSLRRVDPSAKSCPGCSSGNLRRGRVLDPFAGSGTTLAVATGHGRDATGIDIDPRNADLARERVGMFLTINDKKRADGPDQLQPRPPTGSVQHDPNPPW